MSEKSKCPVCNTEYNLGEEKCKKCDFEFIIMLYFDQEIMDTYQQAVIDYKRKWVGSIEEIGLIWYDYSDIKNPIKNNISVLQPIRSTEHELKWAENEQLQYGFYSPQGKNQTIEVYIKSNNEITVKSTEITIPSTKTTVYIGMRLTESNDALEIIVASKEAKESNSKGLYEVSVIKPIL